jgi:hypothetical protein
MSLWYRSMSEIRLQYYNMISVVFGSKSDKIKREWRKLHNEELNDLYCSPNIFRVMGGACSAYRVEGSRIQVYGRET